MISEVLMDEQRSGAPVTFSAEQVTQIIAIACSDLQASGRPISHWSSREIASEAIKRGIVETISTRSVERFLKRSRLKTSSKSLLAEC
jgi:putative transposase